MKRVHFAHLPSPAAPRAGDTTVYASADGQLRQVLPNGADTALGTPGALTKAAHVNPATATPQQIAEALIAAGLMEEE